MATWIGANDQANQSTWLWAPGGQRVSYTDWGPGEPSGLLYEDCVLLWPALNYHWADRLCYHLESFLCEEP